jgi:hypothetical protein
MSDSVLFRLCEVDERRLNRLFTFPLLLRLIVSLWLLLPSESALDPGSGVTDDDTEGVSDFDLDFLRNVR